MKTNYISKLLILALFVLSGIGAKAQCMGSWKYVVPIGVSNSTSDGFSNFQVKVNLANTATLVSAGKMKSDGSDIRFTDNACNTLNYWIENNTFGTSNCVIWVKTKTIPANGSQTINMYYGNSSATAMSNGDSTFDLFEDFVTSSTVNSVTVPDANKWTTSTGSSNSWSFNSGIATINGTAAAAATQMVSNTSFPSAIIFESNITSISLAGTARGGKIGMAILNNGGAGYTLYDSISSTASTSPIKFSAASGCSGSWGSSGNIKSVTQSTLPTGTWGIFWPANGTEGATWPGGSYSSTDATQSISTTVKVAFGAPCSGRESFTADWLRVRKYAKTEPTTTPGNEYSNVVAITSVGGPYCGGATVSLPYTINGIFNSGNTFTAQISDASGSFASPANIGSVNSTSAGNISVTLPSTTGTGYQIRILSSDPVYTGVPSAAFSIVGAPAANAGSAQSICAGGAATIGAAAVTGDTYSWVSNPSGFTSSAANPTVSPSQTTTYTLTESNSAGCTNSNSVTVTVNSLPAANAGSNQTFTQGGSASLGATAVSGSTYSWSPATGLSDASSANPTVSLSTPGTYTYTLTEKNAAGCTASNTVTVTVNGLPVINIQGNSNNIAAGSTTVSSSNNTDFGTTSASNTTVTKTYTIQNTGTADLTVSGISISDNSNYTISGITLPATIAANGSSTFSVTFKNVSGLTSSFPATVTVSSNDATNASYKFAVNAAYTWPVVNVQGNGNNIAAGSTTVSSSNNTDFGTASASNATITKTFTIQNNGTDAVTISGVSVSDNSDYTVSGISANTTIAANGSTTFTVTFKNVSGLVSSFPATVTVSSNDPANPSYKYAVNAAYIYPVIGVQGNGNNIAAGSTTVSSSNNTDFGTASASNTTITKTFTIKNTGTDALTVSAISVSDNSDYTVSGFTANTTIAANGSSTFSITFKNVSGLTSSFPATVKVFSNDPATPSYTYAINAAYIWPVVNVQGNGNNIAAGSTTVSSSNNTDFGTASASNATISKTFTIQNNGTDAVTISGVSVSDNSDYTVSGISANTTIAANGSATFTVTFKNVSGLQSSFPATVTVSSNDPANPSYKYAVNATYVYPVIVVKGNGNTIASNGSNSPSASDNTNFGSTTTGSSSETYTIYNTGTDVLNISNITIGGTNASHFSIANAPSSVAANGSATFTVNFSSTTSGAYPATVTVSSNDPSTPSYVYNIKAASLNASVTANGPTSFCDGGSVTLTSSYGPGYQWNDDNGPISGATDQTLVVTEAGNYYVTMTADNVTATSNTVSVTVNDLPAANAGTTQTVCAGSSAQIGATAVSGSSYSWTSFPSGFTSTSANPVVSPSATTAYTLTETNAAGCSNSNSVTVKVNDVPVPNAGNDATILQGDAVSIGSAADSGAAYSWTSNPSGFTSSSAQPSVSPSVTTTYTVTETNAKGCSATDKVTITVTPLKGTITPGGPTTFCAGGSVDLTANSADAYQWSDANGPISGATLQVYTATASGTYYVTITNGSATAKSAGQTVTVNALPADHSGTDVSICAGSSAKVGTTAVSGSTYSWTSDPSGFTSTSANPTVTPSTTTAYTLTETSAAGCSSTNTVTVTVNPLPLASAGSAQTITSGQSTTLGSSADSGATYSWTSNPSGFTSTSANPTVSPTATTTYTVTETSYTGCKNTNSVTITVTSSGTKPTICVSGPTTFCDGGSVKLTSSSASKYQWYNGSNAISGATYQYYTATTSGTYYVNAYKNNVWTLSNGVTVTVVALPNAYTGSNVSICKGNSITLGTAAVSGSTYKWTTTSSSYCGGYSTTTTVSTAAKITVTPSSTTTYTLTETNSNGCKKTNSVTVTVVANPSVSLCSLPTVCAGSSAFTLSGGSPSGGSYTVDGVAATTFNPATAGIGTHKVVYTYTNSTGCSGSASGYITVKSAISKPTISTCGSTTICDGGTVKLTSSSAGCGGSYSWSNQNGPLIGCGYSGQSITVSKSGSYTVTVTSGGCSATSDATTVNVTAAPTVSAGADVTYNYGYDKSPTLTATASTSGVTYLWSTGATTQSITVSPTQTTTYWVKVSKNGCTSTADYVTVYVRDVHCYDKKDKERDKKCVICHYDSKKKEWGHCSVYKTDVSKCQSNGDKFDDCKDFDENINDMEAINVFPNPFTNSTNIRLSFDKQQQVTVDVVTMDGKIVTTLFEGSVTDNTPYNFTFDGNKLHSGIYLLRVVSGDHAEFRRMVLLSQN